MRDFLSWLNSDSPEWVRVLTVASGIIGGVFALLLIPSTVFFYVLPTAFVLLWIAAVIKYQKDKDAQEKWEQEREEWEERRKERLARITGK